MAHSFIVEAWSIFLILYTQFSAVSSQCTLEQYKNFTKVNVTAGTLTPPAQVPLINSSDSWCGAQHANMTIDIGIVVLLNQVSFQGKKGAGDSFPSQVKIFAGTQINDLKCLRMDPECMHIDSTATPGSATGAETVTVFNITTPIRARYIKYQPVEGTNSDKYCLRVEAKGCPIDYCSTNPCLNGGTCNNQLGVEDYICTCATGFYGKNCSDDYCSKNPCLNGGNCSTQLGIGDYNCTCATGFYGKNCSNDDCSTSPCLNGGTCNTQLGVEGYNCTCATGFYGKNCSDDYCSKNPCLNGGNCSTQLGVEDYNCTCATGFYGKNCSNDDCSTNPCLNGGTCNTQLGVEDYNCTCATGFYGKNCSDDDCSTNPCLNGGTCNTQLGVEDYNCTCATGFYGKNCSDDDCSTNPCLNGGTCSTQLGVEDYSCTCATGFNGKNCSNNINDCASSPCKNRAICTDLTSDYSCTCYKGFRGRNCTRACTDTRRELGVAVANENADSYLRIPDESMTSSSVLSQSGVTYGAYRGRLGQKEFGPFGDAWCTATAGQYIQVNFDLPTPIEMITTKGSTKLNSWVTEFYVRYSEDKGKTYQDYIGTGSTKIQFTGNSDSSSSKSNDLFIFNATNVRIYPTNIGGNQFCMQVALYGCPVAAVLRSAPVPVEVNPQVLVPIDPASNFFTEANEIYIIPMALFVFLFFVVFLLWLSTWLCRCYSSSRRQKVAKEKMEETLEVYHNSVTLGNGVDPYVRKREIQTVVVEMDAEPEVDMYEVIERTEGFPDNSELFKESNKIFTFNRDFVKYD